MSLLILSITAKHNYCSMSRNPGLHFIFQENNDCLFPTLKKYVIVLINQNYASTVILQFIFETHSCKEKKQAM